MSYQLKLQPTPQIFTKKYFGNALAAACRVMSAVFDAAGRLCIGTDKGVLLLEENGRFLRLSGLDRSVYSLCLLPDGAIAAAGDDGIYAIRGTSISLLTETGCPVLSIRENGGSVFALTQTALYRYTGEGFVPAQDVAPGQGRSLAVSPEGEAWVASDLSLLRLFGKRPRFGNMLPCLTNTPEIRINCMAADGFGALWCGSDRGLYVFDGKSEWLAPEEFPQFPKCGITALTLGDKNIYVGTDEGLYIVNGENTRFYGPSRYLAGKRVHFVLPNADETELWVGTENGLSRISFVPMTLAQKAAYYESLIPQFTREGYVTSRRGTVNGDLSTGHVAITDNDGLYTADQVGVQAIKYALTGDPAAKAAARRAMDAMLKLQRISGIPGFPARAYRRPGEHRFGNGNPEWRLTADETGPLEWKGETSSDELTGHYFANCWYYDLCADEAEKAELAAATKAMTDHILSHGFTLCDADGLPTTWAHFGPDDLNRDNGWCFEKGVNSLELLSFLTVTHHMTGDETYLNVKRELLKKHHYGMNVLVYKKDDAHSNHIDDRLTVYVGVHLLRLETDPDVRRFALLGLRRHYEYIRDEGYPFAAFLFGWANGGHTDTDEAVRVLEEYPIDLRCYKTDLSGRADLGQEERVSQFGEDPHLKCAAPASERVLGSLHCMARELSGGDDCMVDSPMSWLMSYWLGRYFGFLGEN